MKKKLRILVAQSALPRGGQKKLKGEGKWRRQEIKEKF
jgi:hypothetical protein